MHDIYDPPPVPEVDWDPPPPGRFIFTQGDLICLVALCAGLVGLALVAWHSEPVLALIAAGAGGLVILESWFTALGFLHRCPPLSLKARWTIFLAALLPWLLGVAFAVCLMLCLFWISDHWG
ncbi:MAG: hypothetical protein JO161_06675 [Planctomycetaceae bacterium]|nr:hypothetical protein [Planctomycetaceae bacterium]